jgi:hypothetical protein
LCSYKSGVRGDDCHYLIAHIAPPLCHQLEQGSDAAIVELIMGVLRDMFKAEPPRHEEAKVPAELELDAVLSAPPQDEFAQCVMPDPPVYNAESEMNALLSHLQQLDVCEQEVVEARWARWRQRQQQELLEDATAAQIPDDEWQKRPVVAPMSVDITRWGMDPFAQGAYSYGETARISTSLQLHSPHLSHSRLQIVLWLLAGCTVPKGAGLAMIRRLQEVEPISRTARQNGLPEGDEHSGVLFFAGEATDQEDPQQVHGAMRSGVRVTEQIIARMELKLKQNCEHKLKQESTTMA